MSMIFTFHDNFCDCNQTILHLLQIINRDSNCKKPLEDIKNIKCLLTGKDTTTEETHFASEIDGLEPGDLEKLFAEDGPEEKDTEEPIR